MMTLTISTDLITIASGSPAPQTDAALPDAAPAPDVRLRFEQLLRQRTSLQDDPASQLQPGADGGERASLSAERPRPWPSACILQSASALGSSRWLSYLATSVLLLQVDQPFFGKLVHTP